MQKISKIKIYYTTSDLRFKKKIKKIGKITLSHILV